MNATLELPITEAELLATYPGPPVRWHLERCACLTCTRSRDWWRANRAAVLVATLNEQANQ